eukprot:GHVT01048213.1.p1 GENE.GHVT01048213.1~~GHVT01048213.1.p1  ORF type:complete len:324 (+),score=49.79 GHVT01048213.1:1401-2372(+)
MQFIRTAIYHQEVTESGVQEREESAKTTEEVKLDDRLRHLPEFNREIGFKSLSEQLTDSPEPAPPPNADKPPEVKVNPFAPAAVTEEEFEFYESLARQKRSAQAQRQQLDEAAARDFEAARACFVKEQQNKQWREQYGEDQTNLRDQTDIGRPTTCKAALERDEAAISESSLNASKLNNIVDTRKRERSPDHYPSDNVGDSGLRTSPRKGARKPAQSYSSVGKSIFAATSVSRRPRIAPAGVDVMTMQKRNKVVDEGRLSGATTDTTTNILTALRGAGEGGKSIIGSESCEDPTAALAGNKKPAAAAAVLGSLVAGYSDEDDV